MARNFLKLNADKNEVLNVAVGSIAADVASSIGSLSSNVCSSLKNIGVTFDQAMNLDKHVKSLTRTCFFHLRNIAKILK